MTKRFSVDAWALKKVRLDMADQFVPDVLIGNAADADGRGILLQVTIGGEEADLEGMPVCLAWSHPNGNQDLTRFEAVDASRGLFKVYYPPAMMYPGDVTARVSIFAGGESPITGSRDFLIHIERSPIDEDRALTDESFSEFKKAADLLYATNSQLDEAEKARQIAEDARRTAEDLRRQHESGRVSAENERIAAELVRDAAELERLAAEEERSAAEEDRLVAELGREEAEAHRRAAFAEIEQRTKGWLRYWCGEGEYDPATRVPTVADPNTATMYFVPAEHPAGADVWTEWVWDDRGEEPRWEQLGTSEATVSPITADQMDAIVAGSDGDDGGSEVLTRWGLRYWLALLRGVFSPLLHAHKAADVTSGQFPTERLADGCVTAGKLADGSVGIAHLDEDMREGWESLSQPSARQIPYAVAAGSGVTANGTISCVEAGGIVMLHIDITGPKLTNWTKVADGLPPALPGYGYIQVGTQDFGGYYPAKLLIVGGEMQVRASAGTWTADTVVIYPRG